MYLHMPCHLNACDILTDMYVREFSFDIGLSVQLLTVAECGLV